MKDGDRQSFSPGDLKRPTNRESLGSEQIIQMLRGTASIAQGPGKRSDSPTAVLDDAG